MNSICFIWRKQDIYPFPPFATGYPIAFRIISSHLFVVHLHSHLYVWNGRTGDKIEHSDLKCDPKLPKIQTLELVAFSGQEVHVHRLLILGLTYVPSSRMARSKFTEVVLYGKPHAIPIWPIPTPQPFKSKSTHGHWLAACLCTSLQGSLLLFNIATFWDGS